MAILNPISYILMEISKMNRESIDDIETNQMAIAEYPESSDNQMEAQKKKSNAKYFLIMKTIKSIIMNPNIFMTIFGIIGAFVLPNGLPAVISGVLKVHRLLYEL